MSTVPSPLITNHSIVKYSEGEGLTHTDLLANQNQMKASWIDVLASGFDYSGTHPDVFGHRGVDMPDTTVFVPRAGQGYVDIDSALDTLFQEGWIAQLNTSFADFDGINPRLLMARVDLGAGPHFTHDTADGSNTRVDLIQVRLTEVDDATTGLDIKDGITGALSTQNLEKQTRVQVEFEIKNGTPASTPLAPTPDAGWAELARVIIPAFAASIQRSNIVDMRMPMRVSQYRVSSGAMITEDGDASWSNNGGFSRVKITNDVQPIHAICPVGLGAKRVIGIWVAATFTESGSEGLELNRLQGMNPLTSITFSDLYASAGATNSPKMLYATTLIGTNSASNNNHVRSIWTNGTGPNENLEDNVGFPVDDLLFRRLAVTLKGDALSEAYEVGFVVAEDL